MSTQLTLNVPDHVMSWLRDTADNELRTPESQVLWFLLEAIGRQARSRQGPAQLSAGRLAPFKPVFDELERLRLQQGKPSARMITSAIRHRDPGCSISHTTVNGVVTGTAVPAWPVLELIATVLNGDVAAIKKLWIAASE